jgi:hypothetical protein
MPSLELPSMTRRIFLNGTLQALGAAVALPLAPRSLFAAAETAADAAPLRVLSPGEYQVLAAIADTMIPHGGAFDLGARDVDLARRVDAYLPKMHPDIVTGFRGALVFVEQQAPQLAGKTGSFSALAPEDRGAVFDAMVAAGGVPAGAFLGLKYVCMTHFYTLDAVWPAIGYDGPMLLEKQS